MDKVTIRKISFGSYIKFLFISGISLGIIMSVLFLIVGLAGGAVYANIGNTQYTGAFAGVLGAIISPLICGMMFAWFGVIAYLPLKLTLKLLKGLTVKIQIADMNDPVRTEE